MATINIFQGNTIGDAVLNGTGDISNWSDTLNLNFFATWTPQLYSGQVLQIPTTNQNLNNIRALNTYPANNFTVPDIISQINNIFAIMNGD
jgi:hypothetical protein